MRIYIYICIFIGKFSVFDHYQKARMQFVQTVTDLASRPHNIEYLDNAGALDLLCPLLWDVTPSIQQLTAIALGRLANHDVKIARAILSRNILPQILKKIDKQTVGNACVLIYTIDVSIIYIISYL